MSKRITVALMIGLLGWAWCQPVEARTERKWQKTLKRAAKSSSDIERIEIYERYMEKNPGGDHVDEAKHRVAQIRFERALIEGSAQAYIAFLRLHGDDPLAEEARERILEIRFDSARTHDTEEAYNAFLMLHPEGPEADFARERLEALSFERAVREDTEEAYKAFLVKFPTSKWGEAAREWLAEDWLWQEALAENSPSAYVRYMNRYPQGRYAREAFDRKRRLALLERVEPMLGAWALLETRIPPDMKRPMLFIYSDPEDRVVFYMEARRLHGGIPIATSITALVDGPPILQHRMHDIWMRSVREVDGSLAVEEYSPQFPDITNRDVYRLEKERIKTDRVVRKGLPYKEEYERVARFGTPRFTELLEHSLEVSAALDAQHSQRYP